MSVPPERRVVLVTGLSGAGKNTVLHMLEDVGFEAVDNPPLSLLEAVAARAARPLLAIGIDSRTDGFDATDVLAARDRLRSTSGRTATLVFLTADDEVLIRRFSATRRLHPLAREGRVVEAIAAERRLLAPLAERADHVLDTSVLPLPELRRLVESGIALGGARALVLSLLSFAFPAGLPADADMVFDARFLKNPHYDPMLQPLTGLDENVVRTVQQDADYQPFLQGLMSMLTLLVPRFVAEGKNYATVAIGCTGGQHRSVTVVEDLAERLAAVLPARVERFPPRAEDRAKVPPAGGETKVLITVRHRELGDRTHADVSARQGARQA